MKYVKNMDDRVSRDLLSDRDIQSLVSSVPCWPIEFSADTINFKVGRAIFSSIDEMKAMGNADTNDLAARVDGFTHLNSFVAKSDSDGYVYAIWEFYSVEPNGPYRGKGIDVDVNHQRKGIGFGFMSALKHDYNVQPSGKQTAAGAALLNKLCP